MVLLFINRLNFIIQSGEKIILSLFPHRLSPVGSALSESVGESFGGQREREREERKAGGHKDVNVDYSVMDLCEEGEKILQ